VSRLGRTTGRIAVIGVVALSLSALGAIAIDVIGDRGIGPPLAFEDQLCALPDEWLELTKLGHFPGRSGQVSILPRTPMYMTTGGKGWTHSGPWDYLQKVPLVFYGPGFIPEGVEVDESVTLADVAPTIASWLGIDIPTDGAVLPELEVDARLPRVVVTMVWDGGGWNGLELWPDEWPTLKSIIEDGVSYSNAIVGSSPSVTPAVHTTLGTGVFPSTHGVTDVPVRDDDGTVVDAFFDGKSARFIEVPTLAERWDERNDGRALIGMIGYEPWHLGMIGKGAEEPGGDKDHAAWLIRSSNRWVARREHYELPDTFRNQSDLGMLFAEADRADGDEDGRWMGIPLDEPSRIEENPGFIRHHGSKLREMISKERYGADRVTDLLFTNFKQIDRLAHYFNMAAPQVREAISGTDAELSSLIHHLDSEVGRGDYVVIVTADHGMQPDDEVLDAYAIDPNETERDIAAEFGPVVRSVWPTQVFLLDDEMAARGVTVEDVARFLADYRLRDNATRVDQELFGAGPYEPRDRLFQLAVPSALLEGATC
jgi:predicted AlkP superfamily pyrophosphatase or phosphodiesterase